LFVIVIVGVLDPDLLVTCRDFTMYVSLIKGSCTDVVGSVPKNLIGPSADVLVTPYILY